MIEQNKSYFKYNDIVIRICDLCGKKDLIRYEVSKTSRIKKITGNDYCKKCAYKFRKTSHPEGNKSTSWTGGVSLNQTSGYLRINKTNEYLHKKIFGDYIGRKISKKEQVHHIDFDKLNNDIANLYLCESILKHHKIHQQMEDLAFSLLENKIWYNRKSKIYTLHKSYEQLDVYIPDISDLKISTYCEWKNHKKYAYVYIGKKKHKTLHRMIAKRMIGRELETHEHVHHIDGDTLNNNPINLDILNRSEHKMAHNSLQFCIAELYKNRQLFFDKNQGIYYV